MNDQSTNITISQEDDAEQIAKLVDRMINGTDADRAVFSRRDVDIDYVGSKITLPEDPTKMPLRTAVETLERKIKDEETMLDVHEFIEAYPEDALVALNKAMRLKYGWASPTPKKTFFGEIPPDLITVKTGPKDGDSVQVPFGQFTLPGVKNPVEFHRATKDKMPCLVITGQVQKREAEVVKELANIARAILSEDSIYKSKAIRFKADPDSGRVDLGTPPIFLETDNIKPDELILNDDELANVQSSIWTPIVHTGACEKAGVPFNRGVLLEGTYGTGKTMTATVTSKVCVDNGWTYILLDDVRALADVLVFANRYAPAVVFAEDVDRAAATRDNLGNHIINTIDGYLTKSSKVITVLTTNHVERLDKAMLRPGRLDAVISVRPPEGNAVSRLIQLYGRDQIADGEGLDRVSELLSGNIPATIREVVERSKLAAIWNGNEKITENDLIVSANGMKAHLNLLNTPKPEISDEERLGRAMIETIGANKSVVEASDRTIATLQDSVRELSLI
jgi:hypothetical protein